MCCVVGILLNAGIIYGLVAIFADDEIEAPKAIGLGLGSSILTRVSIVVAQIVLGPILGLILGCIAAGVLVGMLVGLFVGMEIKRAVMLGAAYVFIQLALGFVLGVAFNSV